MQIESIQSEMELMKKSSPNFAADLGNFINVRVIPFCKKSPTFPGNRRILLSKIVESCYASPQTLNGSSIPSLTF